MKRVLLNAAVAAALISAGGAHAAATQVNFGFGPTGAITYTGASLDSSTALNFGTSTFDVNTLGTSSSFADDSGAYLGMPVALSSSIIGYSIGSTTAISLVKRFTTKDGGADGSEGDYTATFTTVNAESGAADIDFVSLTFQGTVIGPGGFTADDTMLLNCNQSGGSGSAVNCSFTEQGPPIPAQLPEPATLGLVGLSLAGLIAAGRRRRRPS